MDLSNRKNHWDKIFSTKDTSQVSWFQEVPETVLKIIDELKLEAETNCIDIGCGDSCLPAYLLEKGFKNLSALDISLAAIKQSKNKMGNDSAKVNWIVSDITEYIPSEKFGLWHDRAVFHFLSEKEDIQKYIEVAEKSISKDGFLIIGTFSDKGPDMCSELNVTQYNAIKLEKVFSKNFKLIQHFNEGHRTPSGSVQDFLFCIFKRK